MKKLVLAAALLALLAPGVLAAESPAGGGEDVKGDDTGYQRKAVLLFHHGVKTWLAVFQQTGTEPDMVSLLDERCIEMGYKSYRDFSEAASEALGEEAWKKLRDEHFHGAWAQARVDMEKFRKEQAERKKAGEKDPRSTYVPDKSIIVYLKNGSTIEGIARKGVLSEKRVRVRMKGEKKVETLYLQVPSTEKDAGVRVWYINNIDGFTFLPYGLIDPEQGVEVVRSLTPKESEDIFKDIKRKEEELLAAEKKAKAEEDRMETERAATEKALREARIAKQKGMDVEEARKKRKELLGKFPPSEGWSKEKLAEIRRKWIVLHIPPSAKEREFLALFEKWQTAKREQEQIDGKK